MKKKINPLITWVKFFFWFLFFLLPELFLTNFFFFFAGNQEHQHSHQRTGDGGIHSYGLDGKSIGKFFFLSFCFLIGGKKSFVFYKRMIILLLMGMNYIK